MKKTITVNLGGRAFQITEDAYARLNDYLSSIADCFRNHEGGEEIAADIESRISELCEERLLHSPIKIIDQTIVNDMIKRMGNPENMFSASEEEPAAEEDAACATDGKYSTEEPVNEKPRPDRLFYRNVDDKMIAGVISGAAAYIEYKHPNSKFDTTVLRILAAVLCVALPFLMIILYLVVWCVAPAADNAADKLRMEGIEPTPENIASKITDENYKDMNCNEKNKERGVNKAIIIPILIIVALIGYFKTSPVLFLNLRPDDRAMILFAGIIMIPILYISYNILNMIKKLSSGKAIFMMFLLAIFVFLLMFFSLQMANAVI